jgi:hypothetical protein
VAGGKAESVSSATPLKGVELSEVTAQLGWIIEEHHKEVTAELTKVRVDLPPRGRRPMSGEARGA